MVEDLYKISIGNQGFLDQGIRAFNNVCALIELCQNITFGVYQDNIVVNRIFGDILAKSFDQIMFIVMVYPFGLAILEKFTYIFIRSQKTDIGCSFE